MASWVGRVFLRHHSDKVNQLFKLVMRKTTSAKRLLTVWSILQLDEFLIVKFESLEQTLFIEQLLDSAVVFGEQLV